MNRPPIQSADEPDEGVDLRTKVCLWVIFLGLANFIVYVVSYWYLWGEAINGQVVRIGDGLHYFLSPAGDVRREVSRAAFIYSGIHSISIAPTVGAIMLAMLTLAKERVTSSMRSTIVRGRTLLTILATLITVIVVLWTAWFVVRFLRHLAHPIVEQAASLWTAGP